MTREADGDTGEGRSELLPKTHPISFRPGWTRIGKKLVPSPPPLKEPISGPIPKVVSPPSFDQVLFAAVLALVGFGIVMVYSASAVYATQKFGSASYFLRRDLLYAALGLGAMTFAMRTDFSVYRRWSYWLLVTAVAMLGLVLVAGARINGARRWFHFGPLSFQPAELAKLALVIYLAYSLAKKAEKVRSFSIGFVPHMLVCGIMMLLLLKQPDLGTAVILGLTTLLLLFVAGAKISYLFIALLAALPVVYQAIVGTPWRLRRMLAYLDPWQYRYDVGYQITESLISIGSGGLFGLGLGDGKQKLFFLPESHTDYVMAIVGEELGLIGICAVASVFAVMIWRGARAALRARDAFGCYLGFGITAMFGLQALVNLGVVLGALPTKGLPMPFVSFGGSTLVVDLFAIGILLNISRGSREAVPDRNPSFRLSLKVRRTNRRLPGGGHRVTVEV
jgi:cell division protein FtsW